MTLPELCLDADQANEFTTSMRRFGGLDEMERALVTSTYVSSAPVDGLLTFRLAVKRLWEQCDHVVVRGVPYDRNGAYLLAVAGLLFAHLKTYRGSRLVKKFRMSPWTNDLSHTMADGHFHTDINTAEAPPRATLIQCLTPDPRAPEFGQVRVVRISALLSAVRGREYRRIRQFLTEDEVTMVNDREAVAWRGRIVQGDEVRFHPQTLRDAAKRYGPTIPDLEDCLTQLHALALSLSEPISLGQGDILIVSNRRALHYRGSCTVKFTKYPRDFESREVAVAHAMDELS